MQSSIQIGTRYLHVNPYYIVFFNSYILNYWRVSRQMYIYIPAVPARGGAEVALDFTIRPFSSIELACAVRPPGVVVQACVRACCCVVVQEHDLCAITLQCNAKRTLSSHFTLHFSQPALHTTHFTLHTSSHLISNHLISSHLMSPHLSSSHLIPSLLTCHLSKFFSTVFISSEHWKKFISTHLISSARQKDLTVRAKSFAQKNVKRTRLLHTEAWDTDAFTQKNLDNILCPTKLAQSTSQYRLHKVRPSITLYYKACTKHFPVLLCITKLTQNIFQLLTYDYRSLDGATPIQFTRSSCKR